MGVAESTSNSIVGTPAEKENNKHDTRVYVPVFQKNAEGEYIPITVAMKGTVANKGFQMINFETWTRGGKEKEINVFQGGYSKKELILSGTCTGANSLQANGPVMFRVYRGAGYPLAIVSQIIDKVNQLKVEVLDSDGKEVSSTVYTASEFKVNTLLDIINTRVGETYSRPEREKQKEFDFLIG